MNQQHNPTLIGVAPPPQIEEDPFPLERERQFLPLISSGVFPMPLPPVPKTETRWWPVALLVCAIALAVLAVMR